MFRRLVQKIKLFYCRLTDACSAEYLCRIDSTSCHSGFVPLLSSAHSYFHNHSPWYRAWHHHPNRPHVHWGIFFTVFIFFVILSFSYVRVVTATPNFIAINIRNAAGEIFDGTIDILNENGESISNGKAKNGLSFQGDKNQAKKIIIAFNNSPITSMELDDVVIGEAESLDIPIDNVAPKEHWQKIFALGDITGLSYSRGRYKKIADGKDLFKCAAWDFGSQTCQGRWQKIADIAPGSEYTVLFTPGDPGYAESSRKVNALNKKKELLDYTETISTENIIVLTPITDSAVPLPVKEINVSQVDETSSNNDLVIDSLDATTDDVAKEIIIVDTTGVTASEIKITQTGASLNLLQCVNFEAENSKCARWKKEKNIVPEENYDVIISSPGLSVYGQSRDGLLILDKNYEVLSGVQEKAPDNIAVQMTNMNPYKITSYIDQESASGEIIVDVTILATESALGKAMSFDLSQAAVTSADINAVAVGYDLFNCGDFDAVNGICKGKYKKVKDVRKNEEYSFNIAKTEVATEFFESKKQITLLDKEGDLFDYTETIVDSGIEITPTTPNIIKKIKVENHVENTPNDLKINEGVPPPQEDSLQSFAVDPTGLSASSELEIEAKGNTLFKCKDWDFANSTCLGEWVKYKDLTPGTVYTLPIDNQDPGFMEILASSPAPIAQVEPTPQAETSTPTETTSPTTPTTSGGGGGGGGYVYIPIISSGGVLNTGGATIVDQEDTVTSQTLSCLTSPTTTNSNSIENISTNTISSIETANMETSATKSKLTATQAASVEKIRNITLITSLERGFGKDYVSEEVKVLQKFLNTIGVIVAKTGPGAPGKETRRFGYNTLAAVRKFQLKYGLAKPGDPGYGYVGPATRAKIKELLTQ